MAELQHSQVRAKLIESIVPAVDTEDLQRLSSSELELHALSRAVAVTALRMSADLELEKAIGSLVDGGRDNGIDAVYYDVQIRVLFLVQSKWNTSHSGSVDLAGVLKFLQGVQDLVSLKRDRFNLKIQSRWAAIEDALARLSSVRLVLAYSGSTKIDSDIRTRIDEFVASQNDTSELFFFEIISQRELFHHFVQEAAPPQIDLTIKLGHFGIIDAPIRAVYGQLSVVDVAKWYRRYGNQLFTRNIRHFLGVRSDVNSAISKTVVESPETFWYYNNGITILVDEYSKQAFGGNDRSVGLFDCKNLTVINGAQTVGTIGRILADDQSSAMLLARIIAVEGTDADIATKITRASNTQNRIDARNFVALDPEQERIRTELLIEKVGYEYREGEPVEATSEGFEFVEAITTLACSSADISFVAMSKGYVGGLYADLSASPYKALFNPGTSAKRLWSVVRLGRRIDSALRGYYSPDQALERGMIVHGNRLLLHLTLRQLARAHDISASELISIDAVSEATKATFDKAKVVLEQEYKDAYLAPLFKNVGKCLDVRTRVEVNKQA